jgi:ABC-type transporter Mla MlaB component
LANDTPAIGLGEDGAAELTGSFTFGTVAGIYADWETVATSTSRADLQGVTAFDSAGLALLLEWSALLRDENRQLTVTNAPESLLGLATLCDAGEWLHIQGRENP